MDNNNTDQLEVQNHNNEEPLTSFVVSTLEDENDGNFSDGDLSLREAIAIANQQEGQDTITFNSNLGDSTIALNSSLERNLNINDDLSILGLGQDNLTLDGGFVFNVSSDTEALIDGLTFKGGTVDNSGDLTFSNSTIRETLNINGSSDYYAIISREGNTNIVGSTIADNNGGSNVGIVIESGTATIKNSAITGNDATAQAQAGVIIRSDATVDISNSTIAENRGRSNGGIENAGTVNVTNSTIANNTGGLSAGGINNFADGKATITSSILTNNTGSANIGDVSGAGEYISGGNNLISNGDDATEFVNGVNGDLVGSNGNDPFNPQTELLIDPQLGELRNNGGLTETFALLEESPAIDAGSNSNNLATDQRGEGFERTVGQGTDIGAYEVQTNGSGEIPELIVSTLADENDGNFSNGDLSLREAIALAEDNQTITFDSSLSGGSIILSEGELLIDNSLNINGLGAKNLTIDGNKESRIFQVDDGNAANQITVSLAGLTIKNGRTGDGSQPEINGGGFLNRENLSIIDSALVGNDAGNGGAIYNTGKLQFENSLVEQTGNGTGPIYNDGGIASVINSTFTNNNVPGISAIVNDNGSELTLANSTIADNRGFGAALFNSQDSTATVASTIIAENLAELTEEAGKDDISGNYISNGNNLIGTTNGGSGFDDPSDLVGTADNPIDPKLGELQDNGGLTQTIALLDDSPAIDAGSNPNNLAFDQRGEGFERTVGQGTDIGAYEVQTNGSGEIPELIVSTLADENDGNFSNGDLSLREAIALANESEGEDTITFDSSLSGGTISLTETEPNPRGFPFNDDFDITDSVNINGLGAKNLTIDGLNSGNGIFEITGESTNVSLEGLTLTNGNDARFFFNDAGEGGAIKFSGDNLTVKDSVITNSSADVGGAISSSGHVNIIDSTFTNNTGSGVSNPSGAIDANSLNITNSTISNNRDRGISAGTLNITNSTVSNNNTNNTNDGNSGFATEILARNGTANITSSIVSGNSQNQNSGDKFTDLGGEFISGGNNLISEGDGANGLVNGENGDIVGTTENPIDPQLGELQDNGGATPTQELLAESPAIDTGSNPNNLTTDQRGEGFQRTVGDGTDIGAYEVQDDDGGGNGGLVVTTLEDENDGSDSGTGLSLREAIALANSGNTITFDSSLSEGTITLSQGELLIDQSLNIDGLDSEITVDANQQSRVFNIDDGNDQTNLDVSLDGLTISGGSANQQTSPGDTNPSNFGGGISNQENLNLNNSQVTGNDAVAGGGGILNAAGMLTIENSTISDNSSNSGRVGARGGGILNESGELTINNSTISQNSAFQSGAIATGGETSINNSTISDNQATVFAGGISGSANITSSIVADNSNNNNTGTNNLSGEFTSGGNNLIADGDGATGFTNGENGDIVGTTENPIDPQLGELQDNGGATPTQELLAESPAIDAGSNPNNLAFDQRGEGFDRTVGDGTDIGAYEVQTIINNVDIVGTNNRDILRGTPNGDRIFGLDGDDFIQGLDGNDSIDGGNGSDRILSGSGINTIIDGAGDDILLGGADGDIFLAANAGNDLFRGDTGKDIYVYDLNDNGLFDRDRIIDFEQREDKIAFRTLVNDPQSLDNFADLDTDGSGVLDELDERIQISNSSTVIDFSDIFERDYGSDTITLIGVTNLDSDNFLFGEANLGTEFG